MIRAVLVLSFKSALARRLTLSVALFSIALSTALLLTVERVRHDARQGFTNSVSGVDLVVGPRAGPLELMLQTVFHTGGAAQTMSWASYARWAAAPEVAWAIPLMLGDSHRGFPVLGTTPDYFSHVRHGDRQSLRFAAGQPFAGVFEAVLGSQVARTLGYRVGDAMTVTHGMSELGPEHGDKPFRVVGVLAATGTPMDRTVHVSLESIAAIHLDWVGGAPLPGLAIPADQVRKFDLQPKEITAAWLGLKRRPDVFRVQRQIHSDHAEPLMAVMPGVALDQLWQTLEVMERTLFALSALVVVVGIAGMAATLLAGLNERRRELAILRALGASPRAICAMLAFEGGLVTLVGVVLGLVLQALGLLALAPLAQTAFGLQMTLHWPTAGEAVWLLLILVTGIFASLVPAWRAWRLSLSDGLMPRT